MKKVQVTYKDGEAFVVTKQTQAIVRCKVTAELALEGGIRPNTVDMAALAAGYLALLNEKVGAGETATEGHNARGQAAAPMAQVACTDELERR